MFHGRHKYRMYLQIRFKIINVHTFYKSFSKTQYIRQTELLFKSPSLDTKKDLDYGALDHER